MVDVPFATPETIPDTVPTVATNKLLLPHVPLPLSVNAVVCPAQTLPVPAIAGGIGLIVSDTFVEQPVPSVYVIVVLPFVIPVTVPVDPTVANDVLPLVHTPPLVLSLNVTVDPAQTLNIPPMFDGSEFTVIVGVTLQPVLKVYEIIEVPADTPLTIPELEPIVATAVVPLVQVPPVERSDNGVVAPLQTLCEPDVGNGRGFTVTTVVVVQPVGSV
jgi:hypothetical protein